MDTAAHDEVIVENKKYSSSKKDPEFLLTLVNKYVKVELIKDTSFSGFIHAIDPISHSVILSIPKEDLYQTTVILGHAIARIYEIPAENLKPPVRKLIKRVSYDEILSRKTKLLAWFKWNLLPVKECGDQIVVQSVNILPPYNVSDIYAENPVIALQIRKIIEKMPQDFVAS